MGEHAVRVRELVSTAGNLLLRATTMNHPTVLAMVLAAAAWGCTNPFLKRGAAQVKPTPTKQAGGGKVREVVSQVVFLFTHWQVFLPLAVNQLGSVFNLYALGPGGGRAVSGDPCDHLAPVRIYRHHWQ